MWAATQRKDGKYIIWGPLYLNWDTTRQCHVTTALYCTLTVVAVVIQDVIVKFADNTAVISLLERDETEHGPVLQEFVDWCEASQLELNTSKTKELVFDFRREAPSPTPTLIKGEEIEMVTEYKYLGLNHNYLRISVPMQFLKRANNIRIF